MKTDAPSGRSARHVKGRPVSGLGSRRRANTFLKAVFAKIIDDVPEHIPDLSSDARQSRVLDCLHGRDRVYRRNLDSAILTLLDDDIAGQHGSDLVLGLERLIGHVRIAGAQNAVRTKIDVEFLLQGLLDIDLGQNPEAVPLQDFVVAEMASSKGMSKVFEKGQLIADPLSQPAAIADGELSHHAIALTIKDVTVIHQQHALITGWVNRTRGPCCIKGGRLRDSGCRDRRSALCPSVGPFMPFKAKVTLPR